MDKFLNLKRTPGKAVFGVCGFSYSVLQYDYFLRLQYFIHFGAKYE